MGRRAIKTTLATSFALLALALCLPSLALASDQTDRSFGQNGVAEVPQAGYLGGAPAIVDLANDAKGKMVAAIGGGFGGERFFWVARFGGNGALDRSFGGGGFSRGVERNHLTADAEAEALTVQKDGKIVVVGYNSDGNRHPSVAPVLARFGPNGKLDNSFGGDGVVSPRLGSEGVVPRFSIGGGLLHDVAIAPDGDIIAVGAQNEDNTDHFNPPRAMVIAYRPDGTVDTSFGRHGRVLFPDRSESHFERSALLSVKILPDGKILAAGYLHGFLLLVRLLPNGALDPSFGRGDGKVVLHVNRIGGVCCQSMASILMGRHGQITVAGEAFFSVASNLILVRFDRDGSIDRRFARHGTAVSRTRHRLLPAYAAAMERDGRVIFAGVGERKDHDRHENPIFAALRVLRDGKLDRGFGEGGLQSIVSGDDSVAIAALTQPDGSVVVAGSSVLVKVRKGEETVERSYKTKLLLTRYRSGPGP
jgi:uncharacterized delta-60 repeat protein